MTITKSELKSLIKECLREELDRKASKRTIKESSDVPVEEFNVREYARLVGGKIHDWDIGGKRAVKIYEPEDMPAGMVGVQLEDGTYGFVGLGLDDFADSKEHMMRVICDEDPYED